MASERISQLPSLATGQGLSGGAYVPVSQNDQSGDLTTYKVPASLFAAVALSGVSDPGFVVYTGGSYLSRTFTGGVGIYVNNGDGSANPNWNLANTAVSPGTYGTISSIASIVVDQQGRITSASNIGFSAGGTIVAISSTSGIVVTPDPIVYTGSVGIDTAVVATLTNAQTLTNKTLSGGILSGLFTLSGATLSGDWTQSGIVTGGTFSGPTLSGPTINGGTATGTLLSSVTLTGSNVLATTLSGGVVSGSTLSAVTINGSTMTGASTINNTVIGATISSTGSFSTAQVVTLRFGDGTSMVTAASSAGGGTDVIQVQVFS